MVQAGVEGCVHEVKSGCGEEAPHGVEGGVEEAVQGSEGVPEQGYLRLKKQVERKNLYDDRGLNGMVGHHVWMSHVGWQEMCHVVYKEMHWETWLFWSH